MNQELQGMSCAVQQLRPGMCLAGPAKNSKGAIVMQGGTVLDERAIALFKHLKELGFSCLVLSNNKEPRVKSFAKQVGIKYIYKAGKPKPSGYRTAMERLGTDTKNTLFVGDQIFTDIIGANLTGIRSILVAPIDPHEEIQIVLKRFIEKPVIACYKRHLKKVNK